jgi:hypothetical protein
LGTGAIGPEATVRGAGATHTGAGSTIAVVGPAIAGVGSTIAVVGSTIAGAVSTIAVAGLTIAGGRATLTGRGEQWGTDVKEKEGVGAVSIFGGRFEGDVWMADESSLDWTFEGRRLVRRERRRESGLPGASLRRNWDGVRSPISSMLRSRR